MAKKHAVLLLHRIVPKTGCLAQSQKEAENFFAFLKTFPECKSIDVICSIDSQIAWLEEWSSKAAVEEFNASHLAMSSHLSKMSQWAQVMPQRLIFQKPE
jgi:hypothetical protein